MLIYFKNVIYQRTRAFILQNFVNEPILLEFFLASAQKQHGFQHDPMVRMIVRAHLHDGWHFPLVQRFPLSVFEMRAAKRNECVSLTHVTRPSALRDEQTM